MERTLAIIKPDSFADRHSGEIIAMIEKSGFEIIGMKLLHLSEEETAKFYEIHKDKPFFEDLCKYISSGKIIAMVLEAENAIKKWRKLMGATDPKQAEDGTIRKLFGTEVSHNAAHGSDSVEHAKHEIAFFFNNNELVS